MAPLADPESRLVDRELAGVCATCTFCARRLARPSFEVEKMSTRSPTFNRAAIPGSESRRGTRDSLGPLTMVAEVDWFARCSAEVGEVCHVPRVATVNAANDAAMTRRIRRDVWPLRTLRIPRMEENFGCEKSNTCER